MLVHQRVPRKRIHVVTGASQESKEFADPEPADPALMSSLKPIPSPRVPWGNPGETMPK